VSEDELLGILVIKETVEVFVHLFYVESLIKLSLHFKVNCAEKHHTETENGKGRLLIRPLG